MRLPILPAAVLCSLAGCAPPEQPPAGRAPSEQTVRLTRDPGPPPLEAPPRHTLWRVGPDGWRAEARVLAATGDGRVQIDLEHRLVVDGQVLAQHALPPLATLPDGAMIFTRQVRPPERDLWRLDADGTLTQVTAHGTADRPIATPDGRLLHIGSVDGRARWMLDGQPLAGAEALPPPAFADRHRWVDGRLIYDAGEGEWSLDPQTGAGGRR